MTYVIYIHMSHAEDFQVWTELAKVSPFWCELCNYSSCRIASVLIFYMNF